MAWLILLFGIGAAIYVAFSRHLNGSKPVCRHQRLRVMDGEVDSCWSCQQPMPREYR